MKSSEINFINRVTVLPSFSNVVDTYFSQDIHITKPTQENDAVGLEIYKKETKFSKYLNLFLKRVMDICGALVGILLLIPITIFVAVANVLSGDFGPIFYTHERVGKNGKHFKMYKFRTMCTDSDEQLEKLLSTDEEARKEWEANQKLENDPRITKIGKILRKTSIDEVPQFLNVLKGEMSLVGPRAIVDDEIKKFGLLFDKAFSVKPGITGNWAANGRSNTTYEERIVMEATYIDKFSVLFDIKLLFKTVIGVIKKEGAV